MVKKSSPDLLSELPLSIIHVILSFIPIRDAIKTSILSRHWRYIWTSLPHLAFDETCVSRPMIMEDEDDDEDEDEDDENRLIHFISQALLLHKGPIHKFKLHMLRISNHHYICQWLLFLSRNDLRMLIIKVEESDVWVEVHSSLYLCENLTHLELYRCNLLAPPPTFKGFLCLRSINLCNFEVISGTIESIVANSPLLESLKLSNFESSELKISAPNLKYFHLNGSCTELCLHAPLLTEMSVSYSFMVLARRLEQKTSVCYYINLLGGFTKLEKFTGDVFFMKYLSIGLETCLDSLVFHHLRVIELSFLDFGDINVTSVVVRLITGAPNLHKLKILGRSFQQNVSEVGSELLWDSECAPGFTFQRLKAIKMNNVVGQPQVLKFIRFLLERSPVLETFIYKPNSYLPDHDKLNLMAELLTFRRASTNCEILFGDKKRKRSSSSVQV